MLRITCLRMYQFPYLLLTTLGLFELSLCQLRSFTKEFPFRNPDWPSLRNQPFKNLAALRQRVVYQNLAGCIKKVVCDKYYRYCNEQLGTDILTAESLL